LLCKSMTSFWLKPLLKLMQIWLGQNFTYFYIHNLSEE
jgi:hypothetical protein